MDTTFEPLMETDFAPLTALARAIWHQHYAGIVAPEQLDYMLAARHTQENLRRYLDAPNAWYRLLKLRGEVIGYCSYALTMTPGEMKLEQLYLRADHKGQGLGGQMLRHVLADAPVHGCKTLMLQVNKGNATAIAIYRKFGFTVREAAVFDIGHGFVMDDYVMELRL